MKRKIALLLALTSVMVSSCATTALAEIYWEPYDLNGFSVDSNSQTGEARASGCLSKKSDTAVSSTIKYIDVNLPDKINGVTITGIGEGGFMDYDEIKSITLPSTLKTIGNKAFWGSDSFSKITLPAGVESIGDHAFESCDSLAGVSMNNKLKTIGAQAFKNCKSITSLNIPSSVESIGSNAFEGCKAVTTVKMNDGLKELGGGAFKNCVSLKNVTVPKGVTTLKANTFDGCTNLETVTLPEGIKSIENAVFGNCKNLKKVYVPASVKNISKTAFDGAENVTFYCKNGSYAQTYAQGKKFPVVTGEEIITDETIPDKITVIVNGETVNFKNAQPVIVDGRTLVPMREIFESLGLVVGWNGETKTVTGKKGVINISLTIGSSKAMINGSEQKLDVPAQIIDGSTMVPLRVIGNSVGCQVKWDQNTRTVNIVD